MPRNGSRAGGRTRFGILARRSDGMSAARSNRIVAFAGVPCAFPLGFDAGAVRCPAGYCAAMPEGGSKGSAGRFHRDRANSRSMPSDGGKGYLKQKSVNLNHLTLPEIKVCGRVKLCSGCRLNGFRSKSGTAQSIALRVYIESPIPCRPSRTWDNGDDDVATKTGSALSSGKSGWQRR